jgi:hypothetical protein
MGTMEQLVITLVLDVRLKLIVYVIDVFIGLRGADMFATRVNMGVRGWIYIIMDYIYLLLLMFVGFVSGFQSQGISLH